MSGNMWNTSLFVQDRFLYLLTLTYCPVAVAPEVVLASSMLIKDHLSETDILFLFLTKENENIDGAKHHLRCKGCDIR